MSKRSHAILAAMLCAASTIGAQVVPDSGTLVAPMNLAW